MVSRIVRTVEPLRHTIAGILCVTIPAAEYDELREAATPQPTPSAAPSANAVWAAKVIQSNGWCGHVTTEGEPPREVGCILPAGHDGGVHAPSAAPGSDDRERAERWAAEGCEQGDVPSRIDECKTCVAALAALLADVRRETVEACAAWIEERAHTGWRSVDVPAALRAQMPALSPSGATKGDGK